MLGSPPQSKAAPLLCQAGAASDHRSRLELRPMAERDFIRNAVLKQLIAELRERVEDAGVERRPI
jgi:hypothetical protein